MKWMMPLHFAKFLEASLKILQYQISQKIASTAFSQKEVSFEWMSVWKLLDTTSRLLWEALQHANSSKVSANTCRQMALH